MSNDKPVKPKPSLTFSHSAFDSHVGGGTGRRFHQFSSKRFSSSQKAQQYMSKTGVTVDSGVQQNATRLHLSRRGSIIGMRPPNQDGTVDAFRFSSHATTRALAESDVNKAEAAYKTAASELQTRATNTKGKDQKVNTVISDFGQPVFDTGQQQFTLRNATHATGISGSGLHRDVSNQERDQLYEDSIQSHQDRGKTPTASSAFHSEPSALKFNNDARKTLGQSSLRDSDGNIGIMESYINQICAQCGPMLSQRVGTNSLVSGIPGAPFGGQKPGVIRPQDVTSSSGKQLGQATVYRAQPISEFGNSQDNLNEVRAIHAFHSGSQSTSPSQLAPMLDDSPPSTSTTSSGQFHDPFASTGLFSNAPSSSNGNPFTDNSHTLSTGLFDTHTPSASSFALRQSSSTHTSTPSLFDSLPMPQEFNTGRTSSESSGSPWQNRLRSRRRKRLSSDVPTTGDTVIREPPRQKKCRR